MIYLDNAASTRVHDAVAAAMVPYLQGEYGNPSSLHRQGRAAKKAVEAARRKVASLINAEPSEIIITSGGTESNNTVVGAVAGQFPSGGIIASEIEHDAVLEPCKRLEEGGYDVRYLSVDGLGMADPSTLSEMLTGNTRLVSVMLANNEVGTIQPVKELAGACRKNGTLFHTDAVQAVGKVPVDVKDLGVDMLSISSHKLYGPKGVGALYVRRGAKITPAMLGGGQEGGMRSGTENVAGIVGFGAACEIARGSLETNATRISNLRDELVRMVLSEIPQAEVNGNPNSSLPNTAHFTFLGVEGEDLIIKLDEHGIAASTGSACSLNTQRPSHVLQAMGFSKEQIAGSLRLTLGIYNTMDELVKVVGALKEVIAELRRVSPYKAKYSF